MTHICLQRALLAGAMTLGASHANAEMRPHHWQVSRPVATVAAANRAATRQPALDSFVNAVQVYPYSDGIIYQVLTSPGRITDILLQPGETLGSVARSHSQAVARTGRPKSFRK